MTWAFDARQVAPDQGFELWPEGLFPVIITKVEEKPLRNDEGFAWHLTIKGLEGPVKDKTTDIQIQYKAPKQITMDIAQKTMSAIMHVTNVLSFDHPMRLMNIPFFVKSAHRTGKGENAGKTYQDWPEFRNTNGETAVDVYKRLNNMGGAPQQPQGQFGEQPQPQQQFGQQPVQQFQQPQQPAFQQPQQPQFVQQQPGPASAPGYPQDGQGQPLQPPQMVQGGGAWPSANGPQPGQPQAQQPQQFVQQPQQGQPAGAWPQGQTTQPQQPMQPQPGFQQGQPQAGGAAPWNGPTG